MSDKMTTCLWFDTNGEEAVDFYISVFKDAKKGAIAHYGDAGPMPKGTVMTVSFEINGQSFMALNGGPHFKFTPAISQMVFCETQEEIDTLWSNLTSGGGQEVQCGWLTDKFGLSWQIVPREFTELMKKGDAKRSDNMMKALMPMKKLDMKVLKAAYDA